MNILDELVAGIRNRDVLQSDARLFDWLVRAELELVGWDEFPPALLEALLGLFRTDAFLVQEFSWKVLHFIQNNHELLTDRQKEELASFLVEAFPRLTQWMTAFVVAELLGAWYANDDAGVNVFETLVASTQLPVTACIPHGLETIARQTRNQAVRGKAAKVLEALRIHSSELVRQEAAIALDKVQRSLTSDGIDLP